MDNYTIYCTEVQIRKALELEAPLYDLGLPYSGLEGLIEINNKVYEIPTAEQIIGWLEEQRVLIELIRFLGKYAYRLMKMHKSGELNLHIEQQGYGTRKEAILAAIDASLDYLANNH